MPYRVSALRTDAPGVLIVSGLDPSGGAGFIADVRTASWLGCRPVGVITASTEQNTLGVVAANPADPETISGQLSTLLSDVEVAAVKIGMLGSAAVAEAVADALALTGAPVVWDPVLAQSRGDVSLFAGDPGRAIDLLSTHLALITPNAAEASALSGLEVTDAASAAAAGRVLAVRCRSAVLVKGGHLDEDQAIDVLVNGNEVTYLSGPRRALPSSIHGTGCALSTAIAGYLALGRSLADACAAGKEFVAERLAAPVAPGRGARAVL
jgi:hydroxymethylpyrimidine kinase/phosphomethylpyrimidine kinase